MKPGEIITDPERIERLLEMLQDTRLMDRTIHAYTCDGKIYIELPGLLLSYDWCDWCDWRREQAKEVKP